MMRRADFAQDADSGLLLPRHAVRREMPRYMQARPRWMAAPGFFGGSSGASDPYFSNVGLLLHMDGANGSTSFPDNSPGAKTVTAVSGAKVTTASSKFGGGSLVLNGTSDELTVPYSSDFVFGSGNFTVEGWINKSVAQVNYSYIVSMGSGGVGPYAWAVYVVNSTNKLEMITSLTANASTNSKVTSTSSVTTGAWIHFAAVRDGTTLRMFINGVQEGTASFTGSVYDTGFILRIGATVVAGTDTGFLSGNIDDLRITKGVARYTANFTPPTAAYPNS